MILCMERAGPISLMIDRSRGQKCALGQQCVSPVFVKSHVHPYMVNCCK